MKRFTAAAVTIERAGGALAERLVHDVAQA